MAKMSMSAQQDTNTALEDFSLCGEKNPHIIKWEIALSDRALTSVGISLGKSVEKDCLFVTVNT